MKRTFNEENFELTIEFKVKNKSWEPAKGDYDKFVECISLGMAAALLANGNHLLWFWQEFRGLCRKGRDRLREFVA